MPSKSKMYLDESTSLKKANYFGRLHYLISIFILKLQ